MKRKTDTNELIDLRQRGWTVTALAKHFECSKANISKHLKRLFPPEMPESFTRLTEKEQSFVLGRVNGKSVTQSALEAYDCTSRDSAKVLGHELSRKSDIDAAISDLLAEEGLGRRHRIRVLQRHVDNVRDSNASLKGIDIANKMEGIYIEKQVHVHVPYADLTRDLKEVQEARKMLEKELGLSEMSEQERQGYISGRSLIVEEQK